jgi:hypothetical protein
MEQPRSMSGTTPAGAGASVPPLDDAVNLAGFQPPGEGSDRATVRRHGPSSHEPE